MRRSRSKIVINEALGKEVFPGEDPIGKKIANGELDPKSMREIIGVVADVREGGLDDEIWPAEYQAMYYGADNYFAHRGSNRRRTRSRCCQCSSRRFTRSIRAWVLRRDNHAEQMDQHAGGAMLHRFATWMVAGFAAMALVLERRRALRRDCLLGKPANPRNRCAHGAGCAAGSVYKMVMRQAGWLTLTGVAIGLACAVGASC